MYIPCTFVCMDCTVLAVNAHRKDIKGILVTLFEKVVPATDNVSRAVLTRILCNPAEDFATVTPLLDI